MLFLPPRRVLWKTVKTTAVFTRHKKVDPHLHLGISLFISNVLRAFGTYVGIGRYNYLCFQQLRRIHFIHCKRDSATQVRCRVSVQCPNAQFCSGNLSRTNPMESPKGQQRAKIISGTQVSKEILEQLKQHIAQMKLAKPEFVPGLTIVQVGNREDSNIYIRAKIKAATDIGMVAKLVKLPQTATEAEVLEEINKLNNDPKVHGIIVQMALDTVNEINSHTVTDAVDPSKDVDGLCTTNEGRVAIGELKSGFIPCTPYGCIELIRRSGIEFDGAKAVVLGRSKVVGTPVAELLKWLNATVTICHTSTKNLPVEVRQADILVVAIGCPEMIKGDWVKPGAVVIDCGINSVPDTTKKSGLRLVGDVDHKEVSQVASYITPVPGGVGPMTVCMLMMNTVKSAGNHLSEITGREWNCIPLSMQIIAPE